MDERAADEKQSVGALLEAIEEEVASSGFSTPPGATPIDEPIAKRRREPVADMLIRVARKPRTLMLLLLLLAVVLELAILTWSP